MTTVAILRTPDSLHVAYDDRATRGGTVLSIATPKAWTVGDGKGVLGGAGDVLALNFLRGVGEDLFAASIGGEVQVHTVLSKALGRLREPPDFTAVLAGAGRLYELSGDGSVITLDSYLHAVGSGADLALGFMMGATSPDLAPSRELDVRGVVLGTIAAASIFDAGTGNLGGYLTIDF